MSKEVFKTIKSFLVSACMLVTFPITLFAGMGDVQMTDHEANKLNQDLAGLVWQSSFSKSFLVWRRRLLCSAILFLGAGAALNMSDIKEQCGEFLAAVTNRHGDDAHQRRTRFNVNSRNDDEDEVHYTALGKFAIASQKIAPFVSFFVICIAAWFWTEYNRSRVVLVPGWLVTLLLGLWPMLVPLEFLLQDDSTLYDQALLGVTYAVGVLPTYLAIIGGLTLGSKRVFLFAPSPLSGALVVLSAVFALIMPFAALALIVQLLGNGLLSFGLCLLVTSPLIILFSTSRFTSASSFSSDDTVQTNVRILMISAMVRVVGLLFVLAWAIDVCLWAKNNTGTSDEDLIQLADYIASVINVKSIVGVILEFLGGMMFNAVIWTDIMVHLARNDDVKMQKLQSDLFSS